MKRIGSLSKNLIIIFYFFSTLTLYGQNWEKSFGGIYNEEGYAVQQTNDSGFIAVGNTNSFGAGNSDIYLIKTNSLGDSMWTRTFGGVSADKGFSVRQTYDGGYIIGGETTGSSSEDIQLIKTNSNGIPLWTKVFGSGQQDICSAVIQTLDSGFCLTGSTGNISSGNPDIFLLKTDVNGDTIWSKTFGGATIDLAYSLHQTSDSGFIVSGATYNAMDGFYYAYLIRTKNNGDTLWTKNFKGSGHTYAQSVLQTSDGGFFIAGIAGENYLALKIDSTGIIEWSKEIDKGGMERCFSVIQSSDNGFVLAGIKDVNILMNASLFLVKLDDLGNEVWSKQYSTYQWQGNVMIQPVFNNGFIVVGTAENLVSGASDIHLVLSSCGNFPVSNISIQDSSCIHDSLSVLLSSNFQSGLTYQWTVNAFNIVGSISNTINALADGIYGLTVTDSLGCINESNEIYIYLPKAYFLPSPKEACAGDSIVMGSWNSGPDYYALYHWDFGDGDTARGNTVKHAYSSTGTYSVTRSVVTSNGTCNSYSDTVVISTTALPPVDFDILVNAINMPNTSGCPGDKFEFIPYAYTYLFVPPPAFDASSYLWDFGDGTTDTIKFPVHYYSQFGNFIVKLTVTNHCGNSDTVSLPVFIDSTIQSIANFNWVDSAGVFGDTINACESISFLTGFGTTYHWNFDDGTSFTTAFDSVVHVYNNAGNFSIQLITINGCGSSDTISKVLTVVGTCTDIDENFSNEINIAYVFPNPFVKTATVKIHSSIINKKFKLFEMVVYDLQGKKIKGFESDQAEFNINTEGISPGMYFFTIHNGNENIVTGKFITQ